MSELRTVVYDRARKMGRLDLWPRLRVELTSMDEQMVDGIYLDAMRAGHKCENKANSLVAWVLGICDEEPQAEMRMTNIPGLADIDSDYDRDRRDEVIDITAAEFGADNVAHIGTYNQYKLRLTLQAVLKHRGMDAQSAIDISKETPPKAKTIAEAAEANKRLANYLRDHEEDRDAIDGIIGAYSSVGMHPAGIVMSPRPVAQMLPMACCPKGVVTAMDMGDIEELGLVKFDFLGLANVTSVRRCLTLIKKRRGIDVDLTKVPIRPADCRTKGDADIMGLCIRKFDRADVDTIFQFETPSFVDALRQIDIRSFDDLVAIMSLVRPGAKKFISGAFYERFRRRFDDERGPADPENSPIGTYAENRRNPNGITAPHPDLFPILAETYGIPVYQEQALRIVQTLSGATLAEADTLRRAIGKKKGDLFERCRLRFIEGCRARDIDEAVISQVWSLLEKFEEYSFNKAHSCVYSTLAYWNMYLRQMYTAEWYAAVLTTELSDGTSKKDLIRPQKIKLYSRSQDSTRRLLDCTKLGWYRQGAKNNGVDVLTPDVNRSDFRDAWVVDDATVVMPLNSMSSIGGNAEGIVVNRGEGYDSVNDMAKRSRAPISVLRTLIENGACTVLEKSDYGHEAGLRELTDVFVEMRETERATEARLRKTQTRTATTSLFDFEPTTSVKLREAVDKNRKREAEAKKRALPATGPGT